MEQSYIWGIWLSRGNKDRACGADLSWVSAAQHKGWGGCSLEDINNELCLVHVTSTLPECTLICMPSWTGAAGAPRLTPQMPAMTDGLAASALEAVTQGSSCLARGEAHHQGAAVGLGIEHHAQEVAIILHSVCTGPGHKFELLAEGSGPRKPRLVLPCSCVQAAERLRSCPSAQLLLIMFIPDMRRLGTGGE